MDERKWKYGLCGEEASGAADEREHGHPQCFVCSDAARAGESSKGWLVAAPCLNTGGPRPHASVGPEMTAAPQSV